MLHAITPGSRDLNVPLRAYVVRDGQLLSAPLTRSYLNENDDAEYEFEVASPLAEIAYQFFVAGDQNARVSKRYSVRRPCIPQLEFTDPGIDPALQADDRVGALIASATALEDELDHYKRAQALLEEIGTMLKEPE